MNLYELTQAQRDLEEKILGTMDEETGEIPANEELDAQAEALGLAIDAKIDGIARMVRNWTSDVDAWKAEEKRFADKRRASENRIKHVKLYAKACLEGAGLDKLKTALFTVAIQKNGGVVPMNLCVDLDPKTLPERFQKITVEANSSAIREALESGEKLEFAELGERGTSLRIR